MRGNESYFMGDWELNKSYQKQPKNISQLLITANESI